jgi:hypothetical protein
VLLGDLVTEHADDAAGITCEPLWRAHGALQMRSHDVPHVLLLRHQGLRRVDAEETEFLDQLIVL